MSEIDLLMIELNGENAILCRYNDVKHVSVHLRCSLNNIYVDDDDVIT